MTPDLFNEFCLVRVRHRQHTAAVTDGHRRKIDFFPFGTVAAASLIAPALVMTVLYFTVIVLSLIRGKP